MAVASSRKKAQNEKLKKELNLNEKQFREFSELLHNAYLARTDLVRHLMDPRRDIDEECGYPSTKDGGVIDVEEYIHLFEREAIAARVVRLWPDECWQVLPWIQEGENREVETEFEAALEELGQSLKGHFMGIGVGSTFSVDEEANPIWEYCYRVDVESGISQYGVMLLGVNDNKELHEELVPSDSNQLMFIRVFNESSAKISKWENDETSPRLGLPTEYSITFHNTQVNQQSTGGATQGSLSQEVKVHYTRIIHVADNLGSNEVLGRSRQQQPLNRLLDIRKVSGGGAEGYWAGAFPGISFETHPELGGEVDVKASDLRDMVEQYLHRLQRYLLLTGMSAKVLSPNTTDPTPWLDALITQVCIAINVPKRVFMGSELGELASSQDSKRWNKRVMGRQKRHCTPRIIEPLIDRLIWAKMLPEPTEGYSANWPDITAMTEAEKADVAVKRSQAITQYVTSGAEALIAPLDFLTRVLEIDREEALEILKNAEANTIDLGDSQDDGEEKDEDTETDGTEKDEESRGDGEA